MSDIEYSVITSDIIKSFDCTTAAAAAAAAAAASAANNRTLNWNNI